MAYKDHQKALEYKRRWRARKHAEKYGANAGDMRGKHGNQARGYRNGRWNKSKIVSSHGYICLRVPLDHPHAFGGGYCYEHIYIMVNYLERALTSDEVVHHINGNSQDNRMENLKLMTSSEHMKLHCAQRRQIQQYPAAENA